jgi:hypothetical protein
VNQRFLVKYTHTIHPYYKYLTPYCIHSILYVPYSIREEEEEEQVKAQAVDIQRFLVIYTGIKMHYTYCTPIYRPLYTPIILYTHNTVPHMYMYILYCIYYCTPISIPVYCTPYVYVYVYV